jgi:hypothetical protein
MRTYELPTVWGTREDAVHASTNETWPKVRARPDTRARVLREAMTTLSIVTSSVRVLCRCCSRRLRGTTDDAGSG